MIVLDTQVMLFDALEPKRLSRRARGALAEGADSGTLACSDISLWEIAMAIARRRVAAVPGPIGFMQDLIQSRSIHVLPITPEIAVLAQSDQFAHGDPADRIIAATALARRARLVSAHARLRRVRALDVIW